jgi:hypothetical protein
MYRLRGKETMSDWTYLQDLILFWKRVGAMVLIYLNPTCDCQVCKLIIFWRSFKNYAEKII